MFKRLLDPKVEKRPVSVLEVNKYLEDRWLAKLGAEKALNGELGYCAAISLTTYAVIFSSQRDFFLSAGGADERDELCPSMYSFHSSLEEKNQLLHTLTTYGIETTVDRTKKKDRIREWIQASAIVEETEEDESDIYEDSEFYEDENNDGNDSEEPEPVTMRGRHFPERRPSAAKNNLRKRRDVPPGRSKTRAPVKPVERKIPFAPQVAEERETIARFASFPNGDPNLAVRNGSDQTHDSSANVTFDTSQITNPHSRVSSVNNRRVDDSIKTNASNSHDNSPVLVAGASSPAKQSPPKSGAPNRSVSMSPQIPIRKNRTAPFSNAQLVENRAESTRRAQSAEDSPLQSPRASPKTTVPMPIRDKSSIAILSTPRTVRSAAASVGRVDRAPAPIIGNATLADSQQPLNSARAESSPSISTQIGTSSMPTASHLAMQSFNALQNIKANDAPPSSSSSNVSKPGQRVEQVTVSYGKDLYEHYGIAQGAIHPMRVDIVRQDSTGSGNRSVSN